LRSMHTGQNSIAPENWLPQLGQARCGCVFMGLTVLRRQSGPKRCTTLHRVVPSRRARLLANCRPVPQAIACSYILARQMTFQIRIPTPGALRHPVLTMSFIRWGGSGVCLEEYFAASNLITPRPRFSIVKAGSGRFAIWIGKPHLRFARS
jgi:hypothetical protein